MSSIVKDAKRDVLFIGENEEILRRLLIGLIRQ